MVGLGMFDNADRHVYLRNGFSKVVTQKNYGCLSAFLDKEINRKGFEFTREEFVDFLDDFGLLIDEEVLPDRFNVSINYSSVSNFNRWIFDIANHKYALISDKSKFFNRKYYMVAYESTHKLVPIEYNIVHEKFLLSLYEKKKMKKSFVSFNFIMEENEVILYKDFKSGDMATLAVGDDIKKPFDKKVDVLVMYARNQKVIEYRIKVDKKKFKYSLMFSDEGGFEISSSEAWGKIKKSSAKKVEKKLAQKDSVFQEVIELINKFSNKPMVTTKNANISLGRVAGIQVLLNLPVKKFAEVEVKFHLKGEEVLVFKDGEHSKTLYLIDNPKSNWIAVKKP